MAIPRGWSIRMCLAVVVVAVALGGVAIAGVRTAQGTTSRASHAGRSTHGTTSRTSHAGRFTQGTTSPTAPVTQSAVSFHDAMRKLWEDHITWTRNVIISFELNDRRPKATLPDLSAALGRLFQNQVDIGDGIKPYYGEDAGNKLTALLHDHIAIAGEILQAVKTGDTAAYQDANARWYANAHDIAVFLSQTLDPPLGSLAEMDQMMKDHLDSTTAEVVARKTGDWTGDVAAYDKVHAIALQMADMLSAGIIANFKSQFRP